jgi:hypothetical protein
MRDLIFSFVGEFGYELLNWQGVIRKLRHKLDKENRFVICSRKGLNNFYEYCDEYIEISDIDTYKNSIANGYLGEGLNPNEFKKLIFERLMPTDNEKEYFLSSNRITHHGLTFGYGGLYLNLDLNNNMFAKILPDLSQKDKIKEELGFDIEKEPYILIQAATRSRGKTKEYFPLEQMLSGIETGYKIVLLGFDTLRKLDSYSDLSCISNFISYKANNFVPQGCLIHYAKKCVFFTEGDFRSHIYVPPFMGKDVYAVAHEVVYNLPTAPFEFWNSNVFCFGGQIKPVKLNDKIMTDKIELKRVINDTINC